MASRKNKRVKQPSMKMNARKGYTEPGMLWARMAAELAVAVRGFAV